MCDYKLVNLKWKSLFWLIKICFHTKFNKIN